MGMTDPIADLLTRIRNANKMRHATVEMPSSKFKISILSVMKAEGFIDSFEIVKDAKGFTKLVVTLKYVDNKERVIIGLKRISKPGLRVYSTYDKLPRVWNGLGVALVSTSKGILTDSEARRAKIGGEVLAYIW